MPAHFGLPVAARYTTPQGYLGPAYDAFNIKGDPRSPELKLNKLSLSPVRFEERRSMLTQLDNLSRLGFTKYEKRGDGYMERTAGKEGPKSISLDD